MAPSYSHFQSNTRARARVAQFATASGAAECHLCIEAPGSGSFAEQLAEVEATRAEVLSSHGLTEESAVMRRVFLSDVANQQALLDRSRLGAQAGAGGVALSVLEQPPFEGQRICVWEYHVRSKEGLCKRHMPNGIALERSGRSHLWTSGMTGTVSSTAFEQTATVLCAYEDEIATHGATLREHTVRTWFYVSDIDAEYAALVAARKRHFHSIGLTADTHYITSTGIAGRGAAPAHRILLDAYAVSGLSAAQVRYLSAPAFLGPTHVYGVTFERGTRIAYGDRSHVYLSGTASIDPEGNTLHCGDIRRQCRRALENTHALLEDAGAGLTDLVQLIAYVRDPADAQIVREFLAHGCPEVPRVIVRAPVCRPNWLVEFECIALLDTRDPLFLEF